MTTAEIRPAVSAGRYSFYPSDPRELRGMLTALFERVEEEPDIEPVALISPHAGYVYSGQTAAYGYKLLREAQFERVIVLGPSHYAAFPGASIYNGLAYSTPLGDVPLDTVFIRALRERHSMFHCFPEAETREHSLEVQLPFLQARLHSFTLVPIVVYDQKYENCRRIAEALEEQLKGDAKSTLIVASSDLYHGPDHNFARRKSEAAAQAIERMDPRAFADDIANDRIMACGAGPVTVAMILAGMLGADRATVMNLTTSYEVQPGNDDYVVGYLSAALHRS